jgi:hypothetical protein
LRQTATSKFIEYLGARKPRSWVLEQNCRLRAKQRALGNKSVLDIMQTQCRDLGYAITLIDLNHSDWATVSRQRYFLIGVDEQNGGGKAMDFIRGWITACIQDHGERGRPLAVFDILDVGQETARAAAGEA